MSKERELLQRLVEVGDTSQFLSDPYSFQLSKLAREARALLAQEQAPAWTDTPPTEPGPYWYKEIDTEPEILCVDAMTTGLVAFFHGFEDESPIASLPGQWQGPIKPRE